MKAIYWKSFGGPEALEVADLPKPKPQGHELLVRVKAFTVNRTDCARLRSSMFIMRLQTGLFKPNKPVLGTDFAGQIEAVGDKVTRFQPGDSIVGFDDMGLQSQAEYMVIKESKALSRVPENVSYETAVASLEGPHYAINMINKVKLKEGHSVLVNGATGGIGSAAVKLLVQRGARVTATCRTEHFDIVKAMGAEKVIDYTSEDFTKLEAEFDFIFDTVGKSRFSKCKPILKTGGSYISSELGPGSENLWYALTTPIFAAKKARFPFPFDKQGSVDIIVKLLSEGNYKPLIDRTFSLDEAQEAYRYVLTGQKVGNVIIEVN